jgi:hypothetical protein
MTPELQDILGTILTTTFLADAFAVALLVLSVAAVWLCRPRHRSRADRNFGELAGNGEH